MPGPKSGSCLLDLPADRHLIAGDAGGHGYKVRYFLAETYNRQGRWADAEDALRAALALDPNQKEARDKLDVLLRQHKSGRDIPRRLDGATDPEADA